MPFIFRVFEGCFLGEEIRREVWVAGSCLMDVVERLHEPLKDVFWSIAWHERDGHTKSLGLCIEDSGDRHCWYVTDSRSRPPIKY